MKPVAAGIAFVVGVVGGVWLGRPPRPSSSTPEVCPPAAAADCDVERLAVCTREVASWSVPRPSMALPFAVAPEREQPDVWPSELEALLARCTSGLDVLAVDCASYPCVAAIESSTAEDWDDACETGGWVPIPVPLSVRCGDGGVRRVDLMYLVDFETLGSLVGRPENEEQDGIAPGVLGQRVDAVLGRLPCASP